jgi:sulfate adenylyltransferase subunit 2
MNHLDYLESQSIYIIREAYAQNRKTALLWSIGKDSTAMLWLTRKAFLGEIPFPVLHIDTTYKFGEIYEFRDKYQKEWGLDLIVAKNEDAIARGMGPVGEEKLNCCNQLKTDALKLAINQYGFDALLLAIRRDEHGIRAKERVFSPRTVDFKWNYMKQPVELWNQYGSKIDEKSHMRIHPMLHWTEHDIWAYTQREKIPVISLYYSKDGKRYRSIGCKTCCLPVDSKADTLSKIVKEIETTDVAERSGRAQDKEDAYTMQKLRSLGYM